MSRQTAQTTALFCVIFLLAACSSLEPPQKVTGGTMSAAEEKAGGQTSKGAYDVRLDFAGGGDPTSVIDQVSARDTIIHSLKQHTKFLDLETVLAVSGKITRDDLLVFQGPDGRFARELNLAGVQLGDRDIEPLSDLELTRLIVTDSNLKDLHALKPMVKLQRLEISGCPIDSDGIAVIAGLPLLVDLQISRTPIRDQDLTTLSRVSGLRTLIVIGCPNLSPAGVQRFKVKLPNCSVRYIAKENEQTTAGDRALVQIERSLMRDEEYGEADMAVEKLIKGWQSQSSPDYDLIASGYVLRADCQRKLGDRDKNLKMLQAALDVYLKHHSDHPDIPVIETQLAGLMEQGQAAREARTLRLEADRFWQHHPPQGVEKDSFNLNMQRLSQEKNLSK